jgi:hypothetical protein
MFTYGCFSPRQIKGEQRLVTVNRLMGVKGTD